MARPSVVLIASASLSQRARDRRREDVFGWIPAACNASDA
jgi:hypothetical protein